MDQIHLSPLVDQIQLPLEHISNSLARGDVGNQSPNKAMGARFT
jgi:hypothetical protein